MLAKWAISACSSYPDWATLVPTSILVGFASAPLWTAQCSYFTVSAGRYAKLSGELEEAVVARFFAIFFFFFHMGKSQQTIRYIGNTFYFWFKYDLREKYYALQE